MPSATSGFTGIRSEFFRARAEGFQVVVVTGLMGEGGKEGQNTTGGSRFREVVFAANYLIILKRDTEVDRTDLRKIQILLVLAL